MSKERKKILSIISTIVVTVLGLLGVNILGEDNPFLENSGNEITQHEDTNNGSEVNDSSKSLEEDGHYTDVQNVKEFIEAFDQLPDNYITKDEAYDLGWVPNEGNLHEVAPGMSIGGDYFGNFEGHLPDDSSRSYYEADINYEGGYRGAERLVYSDDGLFFYTDDHYETFEEVE